MNAAIETRFFVLNMSGDDSIATARAALAGVPGFVQADFDLRAGTATVKGDVDPQAVAAALTCGLPGSGEKRLKTDGGGRTGYR